MRINGAVIIRFCRGTCNTNALLDYDNTVTGDGYSRPSAVCRVSVGYMVYFRACFRRRAVLASAHGFSRLACVSVRLVETPILSGLSPRVVFTARRCVSDG